jgi:hypothetical protein
MIGETMMTSATPLADPVAELQRIHAAAEAADLTVRAIGGLGVAVTCPSALRPPLTRTYADIDIVGRAQDRRRISGMLESLGYRPDPEFNSVMGHARLYFWDAENGRQLDVFLDRFVMCHTIDLSDRLDRAGPALSPADLLITKLQVVETNRKDLLDSLALLVDHELTDGAEGIDMPYVERLVGEDWGLWRTLTMVAERAEAFSAELNGFSGHARIVAQVAEFSRRLDAAPKSRRWRMRARVGDRKRWYELPEEAH